MRITSLEIERFGVWENLYLPKIRRGINVFYGPNEAGKTTLMQFIRSGLYGCANPERARYIQMALYPRTESPFAENRLSPTEVEETDGRRKKSDPSEETRWIGGVLTVRDEYGTHRLERRYVRRSASALYGASSLEQKAGFIVSGGLAAWSGRFFPIPGTGIAESLIISGDDGQRLSDHFIQSIVSNVDESTFSNVFAIGLDELQKLGSLNETDAAQMLYRLSVGVDRVSLIQVLHQIVEERNEILDIKGKPAILDTLLARRDDLNAKALSASANLREYTELRTEMLEAEEVVRQLDEKLAAHTRQQRIYEISSRAASYWDQRADLRTQLAEYGTVLEVRPDAVDEADGRVAAIADVRRSLADLGAQYKETRRALKNTPYNRSVWRSAPLIEMLVGEIPHLEVIDGKIAGVKSEIAAIRKELDLEEQRLRSARSGKTLLTPALLRSITDPATGLPGEEIASDAADKVTPLPPVPQAREVDDFRVPARAVFTARKRLAKTRARGAETAEQIKNLGEELERELSSRGRKDVDEAITETGLLVSQLQRRQEIAKRLDDLDKIKRELTRQNGFLVANQSLPYPVTIAIGIGVALGGLLAVFALLGKGPFDPSIGILGIIVAVGVLFYKTTIERRNYAKLEENQRQLAAVMKRTDQVKAEAAVIDRKYPAPGQPLETRLQNAQADLAAFDRLKPLAARYREAVGRQKILEKRLEIARKGLRAAHHRWTAWLKGAGLAPTLKPSHIKGLIQRVDFAESLRRRIDEKNALLNLHLREKKGITDRLDLLMSETGTVPPADSTAQDQISLLADHLETVRLTRDERAGLFKKLAGFRRERTKILGRIHHMNTELGDYLSLFDSKSVDHLKELAVRYRSHQDLLGRLASVESQIEDVIGGYCEEAEIADVLDDEKVRPNLPALTQSLTERIEKLAADKKEKTLRIGRLGEQLENLAAQRDFVGHRFESAAVSRRIDEMSRIWQSRAVACKMMEDIRRAYEKERQPETLKEASRLLRRLTDGLYVKIWTPLGEDTLYVDTSDGQTLDIGSLSRGTREQLFIAIRLALATSFEKHGVNLPLILDDVLVNFDNHRAAAAAEVLLEFAESGRQIFLFTCHQHICKTFLKLDRPVFVLPDKTEKVKQFRVILPPSMRRMPDEPEEEFTPKPIPAEEEYGAPRVISPVSVAVAHGEPEEDRGTLTAADATDLNLMVEAPPLPPQTAEPSTLEDDEEYPEDSWMVTDSELEPEDAASGAGLSGEESEDEFDDADEDDEYGEDEEDSEVDEESELEEDSEVDEESELEEDSEIDEESELEEDSEVDDESELEDDSEVDEESELEEDSEVDEESELEEDSDDEDADEDPWDDDDGPDDDDPDEDGGAGSGGEYAEDDEDEGGDEDPWDDEDDSDDEDADDDFDGFDGEDDDDFEEAGGEPFDGDEEDDDQYAGYDGDDDEEEDADDEDDEDDEYGEDEEDAGGYDLDPSLRQSHSSISADADYDVSGPSLTSGAPDLPEGESISQGASSDEFDGDDDGFESSAVSADQVISVDDDTPEEEPKRADSFEFSTWNDFVRSDQKEETPAEEETGDDAEEEENENDFMRRYFTREPQDEFFDEDDDNDETDGRGND